ncbi:MAG: Ig-like domain-containing protein [Bacteroidaceae bacterium]|nr:Ig-like domain-containing protein [Bacteroidaceae bacterium]
MKLRDFLKLMVMAMVLPLAFVACTENDEPEIPESVTLSANDVDMLIGETLQLNATVATAVGNPTDLTWTSSNPNVATVDNTGKVTAVAPGEADIIASLGAGRASATCEVEVDAENMLLVFNGGSYYQSIDGSLSVVKYEKSQKVNNDVFLNTNKRSLGATPQDGIIFGDNLYIAVYQSNTIEVVNKYSFESVEIIQLDEATGLPRDIVADDNYVYVSMYTGYVARIDPKTNKIDKTVQVGPNPEEMVIEDDFLYVVNSDGMNYMDNYANGKTVSKVNLKSFTEEKKIPVGLNPTSIVESDDKLFVICSDYSAPTIWVIENDSAKDTGILASFMAEEDDVLYVIYFGYNEDYSIGEITYNSYKTSDLSVVSSNFVKTPVDAPAGITVDDNRIFVSSYNQNVGFPLYSGEGYVNEYKMDGTLVKRYDVGVGPAHMLVVD